MNVQCQLPTFHNSGNNCVFVKYIVLLMQIMNAICVCFYIRTVSRIQHYIP
jgi:hypothetical protein